MCLYLMSNNILNKIIEKDAGEKKIMFSDFNGVNNS